MDHVRQPLSLSGDLLRSTANGCWTVWLRQRGGSERQHDCHLLLPDAAEGFAQLPRRAGRILDFDGYTEPPPRGQGDLHVASLLPNDA
jgi:hypothetical protein